MIGVLHIASLAAILTPQQTGDVEVNEPPSAGAAMIPCGSKDPVETWELVWSDEFEGRSLDAEKWRAEDAALMNNKELQYYTPDAMTVGDGVLTIRADQRPHKGRQYTSGLIDSRATFMAAFGRFECRARMPRGKGMWSAIWMLPDSSAWPPEIDIMECLGHQPNRIYTTHHWGPLWPNNQMSGAHHDGPDYSADFHVFATEWSPDRIDWLIDGVRQFTSNSNIPQDPFYLIINLAVGGHLSGNPDETTVFPQEFTIDWVRVYQRRDPAAAMLRVEARHGRVVSEPNRWSFKPGESVTLRAEPDIGYVFHAWQGDQTGTTPELMLNMSGNRHVAATFAPAPDAPRLLSQGRPVRASSSEGLGFEPERAVDASRWSRWSALSAADPQWLEVDLGESRAIEAARLDWLPSFAGSYSIEVSDDRTDWTPIHDCVNGQGGVEKITGLSGRGRYVRLMCRARNSPHGYSLFSFDVYGR